MTRRFKLLAAIATAGASVLVLGSDLAAPRAEALAMQAQAITAREKSQGAEAHPKLLEEFGGAYQVPQTSYVVQVGKGIAVQSGLGNARDDFTVTLLNSPVNNAFAIPGGYIYVTRQLMALMNDEAELAGVLGHEVGHVAARHSEKRQKAAQRNSIIGLLGQIGAAVLLGDSAAGQLGQQLFGTGSQLLTLKYSRKQEEEADDLGVRYLAQAGYDPQALSSMLASLAAQQAMDVRAQGGDARSVPEWASTHPDPARRVSRAATIARKFSGTTRNRDVFLTRLDGLLYGDDPKQGMVQGREFLHPELGLKFAVPQGFSMQNGTSAVTVNGQSAQAQFTLGSFNGDLARYVDQAFSALGGNQRIDYGQIQRTTVNGLPAAYATARVNANRQLVDVTVFAYQFAGNRAYHFVALTPAGQSGVFSPMYQSVRRLAGAEAAQIKPRRVRVVDVQRGDTLQRLASRMAYDDLKVERFMALNGLATNSSLVPGQKVKIVTY
ncbi:putative Zn-dependent protease [Blastomonas natatoria]|uniref:Putative Zn-dependent protease n=1 Tax=Blastomonas natatoria TaxID=34015 RepID=A0A2V3V3K6_9SPHN|nr:M48 family metalloprotease [Blastomonas natatoria]PXW68481.1 putative Zn-dependent protease [Blastomonas natatoria]